MGSYDEEKIEHEGIRGRGDGGYRIMLALAIGTGPIAFVSQAVVLPAARAMGINEQYFRLLCCYSGVTGKWLRELAATGVGVGTFAADLSFYTPILGV